MTDHRRPSLIALFRFFRAPLFGLSLCLISAPTFAAQDLIIRIPEALLLEIPAPTGKPIDRARSGVVLKGSNAPKDGYYKVLLPHPTEGKKFGWVPVNAVTSRPGGDAEARARVRAKDSYKKFRVVGLITGVFVNPGELSTLVGDTDGMKLVLHFGADLDYHAKPSLWYGLHVDTSSFSRGFAVAGSTLTYTISGFTILGMVHYMLTESYPLRFWLSGGAGFMLGHSFQITGWTIPAVAGQSVNATLSAPVIDIKVGGEFSLSNSFSTHLRLGYRLVIGSSLDLSSITPATPTVAVGLSGLMTELGIGYAF